MGSKVISFKEFFVILEKLVIKILLNIFDFYQSYFSIVLFWTHPGIISWNHGHTGVLHLVSMSTVLSFSLRFFLMYLINKDETEHTGQVSKNIYA